MLQKNGVQPIDIAADEPLRNECLHFLECLESRRPPLTDASSGIQVLRVLEACQRSLQSNGRPVELPEETPVLGSARA